MKRLKLMKTLLKCVPWIKKCSKSKFNLTRPPDGKKYVTIQKINSINVYIHEFYVLFLLCVIEIMIVFCTQGDFLCLLFDLKVLAKTTPVQILQKWTKNLVFLLTMDLIML